MLSLALSARLSVETAAAEAPWPTAHAGVPAPGLPAAAYRGRRQGTRPQNGVAILRLEALRLLRSLRIMRRVSPGR